MGKAMMVVRGHPVLLGPSSFQEGQGRDPSPAAPRASSHMQGSLIEDDVVRAQAEQLKLTRGTGAGDIGDPSGPHRGCLQS